MKIGFNKPKRKLKNKKTTIFTKNILILSALVSLVLVVFADVIKSQNM